jgi:long-chain fatty acid transport protein
MSYSLRARCLAVATALLVAGQANASGFQVREQSAKNLANAFSGSAAAAEDASFMAYNPASIGAIDDRQVVGGLAHIDPDFGLRNGDASTRTGFSYGENQAGRGGDSVWVPTFAAKARVSDTIDLGLSLHVPYGLSTEYDQDWIGRYHAIESELETLDIQPTLNVRASERLNLAVGLRAEYGDATLSNAIDLGARGARSRLPGAFPGANDGLAEVTGDDWGYGYTLGALFQATERTRLGMAYRSEIDLTLEGEARFRSDDPVGQQVLAGARATNTFTDTRGRAELTTPATLNLGVHHRFSDRLALMANAEWTEWSSFDELVVEFEDNTPDSVTEEKWDDTWAVSVGANYDLTPQWRLRAGLGIDESPVPSARYRTPRIPDADRRWAALGASWQPTPELGVTLGYLHVFADDADIDQRAEDSGNASRGNLAGNYDIEADILSLGIDYRF